MRHWRGLQGQLPPLVTTTYIFDEVVTLFKSRGYHAQAIQAGNNLRSPGIELVHVDEPLFDAGWAYFVQHADKQYSLTDCISFVLMSRRRMTHDFTFDHHFGQAGFTQVP